MTTNFETDRPHPSEVLRARREAAAALEEARAALSDENYIKAEKEALFLAIDRCLRICASAVSASAVDLRGEVGGAIWALARLPFDAADSQRLDEKLSALRDRLGYLDTTAAKLGFPPNSWDGDLPAQHLVPREIIASELDLLGGHIARLDTGVGDLATTRSDEPAFKVQDRMIDFVVETVSLKSRSAAAMADEHQIDISALTHTLAGASRHTKEFKGALGETDVKFTPGARVAGKALRKSAADAAEASLKILRACAESARDHSEAARQSARAWLDFSPHETILATRVAKALNRRGFNLLLPQPLQGLPKSDLIPGSVHIAASPDESELVDFLNGKKGLEASGRRLTTEEKKLWALVARTVKQREVEAKLLNFAVVVLSEGFGRGVPSARDICRGWPHQIVVLSFLSAAQTRLLQETHRAVVPVQGTTEDELETAIEILDQMLTAAIVDYALARPSKT